MHHVILRLSGTPGSIRTPAPVLGQHNHELLSELGIKGEELQALKEAEVLGATAAQAA